MARSSHPMLLLLFLLLQLGRILLRKFLVNAGAPVGLVAVEFRSKRGVLLDCFFPLPLRLLCEVAVDCGGLVLRTITLHVLSAVLSKVVDLRLSNVALVAILIDAGEANVGVSGVRHDGRLEDVSVRLLFDEMVWTFRSVVACLLVEM